MMGSADALPQAPEQKTVFMEDMTDEQLASAVSRQCKGYALRSVQSSSDLIGRHRAMLVFNAGTAFVTRH